MKPLTPRLSTLPIACMLGAAMLAAACGRSEVGTVESTRTRPTSGAPGAAVVVGAAALPPKDSVSAHAPTWSVDLVLGALRSAKLPPQVRGPVSERFLGAPGTLIEIPGAELEVFIYGDAIAAARDIDRLDTLAVSPRGAKLVWRKPPAIVTSNNLVVIVLTADPAVRAHVRDVLGTRNRTDHDTATR